jgi:hypothetical protein
MKDKRCPVFVAGKECGHPLTRVDLQAEKNSGIRLDDLSMQPRSSLV